MTIEITPMRTEHLDQVWQLEQQAHSHPWAESLVRDLSSRGACHHVMLEGDQVVGYFYGQNIVGEVTLLNIAIAPSQQGKGLGQKNCWMRLSNTASKRKQRAPGWKCVKVTTQLSIFMIKQASMKWIRQGNGKQHITQQKRAMVKRLFTPSL